jgi:hypothetical protein
MLMVCMAGTAVKLANPRDVLTIDFEKLEALQTAVEDLKNLNEDVIPSEI